MYSWQEGSIVHSDKRGEKKGDTKYASTAVNYYLGVSLK